MKNVSTKLEGKTLIITIDLEKNFGPSKSGKSTKIASTDGNVAVEGVDGVKMGLNVYKPL